MWSKRAKEIFDKLEPIAESLHLKIVELDLPQGQNGIFRVYVDSMKDNTRVSVDECAKLSPIISDYMDTFDPFPFRYYLEVSSPGLDRPLRRWEELPSFLGKKVKVQLSEKIEDRKKVTGELFSVNDENGTFTVIDSGKEFVISKDLVRKMNIVWEGDN